MLFTKEEHTLKGMWRRLAAMNSCSAKSGRHRSIEERRCGSRHEPLGGTAPPSGSGGL
jgi:hypothetical protein